MRLKKNATTCPDCECFLYWHSMGKVVLLKREADDKKMVYDARCPKCGTAYEIPAPR